MTEADAWSSWRMTRNLFRRSPSVTVQRILDNSSYVRSRLKNSSAASCSTCCPKVSSRCATSAFLHLAAANVWQRYANRSSRSARRTWGREKLRQSQPIQPQSQSCAAQVAASRCFSSVLFSLPDAVHHEPLWFLPSDFSLDVGFQSCTQASIRLSPRTFTQTFFSAHSWLVLVGFLAVQLTYNHLQENGFNLVVNLKFQRGSNVC